MVQRVGREDYSVRQQMKIWPFFQYRRSNMDNSLKSQIQFDNSMKLQAVSIIEEDGKRIPSP